MKITRKQLSEVVARVLREQADDSPSLYVEINGVKHSVVTRDDTARAAAALRSAGEAHALVWASESNGYEYQTGGILYADGRLKSYA